MTMTVGTRVKNTAKFNARSSDPITGDTVDIRDSFRLVKRGTLGTIEDIITDDTGTFAVVKFDGINTRQQDRITGGYADTNPSLKEA